MGAIGMLLRTTWRRHLRASLFLAVLGGLAAAVVGASFQAASRASTTLPRYQRESRVYDLVVFGCPPGVNPDEMQGQVDFERLCLNAPVAERLRRVLARLPGVERTAVTSTYVIGLLDPSVSNHWGRLTLLGGTVTPGASAVPGRPILLEGRLPDPRAPDEIVVSESAAAATGLHAGAQVRMAGWPQEHLDAAIDGALPPETTPFTSTVVGVARSLDDVQASGTGSLSDSNIPGNLNVYAGAGWVSAHSTGLSGYGAGVLVRLRGAAASDVAAFEALLNKAPEGWFTSAERVTDADVSSVRRVIDLERRAVLVFAIIAIIAAVAFVGLTTARQLRRESEASTQLSALGMTRRELQTVNALRGLTVGSVACVIAVVGMVALSSLGPVGLARRLEFDLGPRLAPGVAGATAAVVLVMFLLIGLVAPSTRPATERRRPLSRRSLLAPALGELGPVPAVATTIARGRSSRVAVLVTAVALAAGVAAGGLVASYDALLEVPQRYGASWDVVVGQYSEQASLDEGVAALRANSSVRGAAGFYESSGTAKVDHTDALVLAMRDYVGHVDPVMLRGSPPANEGEAALGRETARLIGKDIGDEISVVFGRDVTVRLRVVGIVVVNDPIAPQASAGNGLLLRPDTFLKVAGPGSVAQSIVVRLDPRAPRQAAIESVRRDFPGSIREALPQVDALNLGRLRSVPWLIAGLVGLLATATLIHALVTILARNRTTLAVMAALGLTRRQRRAIGLYACGALVVAGVALGVPLGLVLAARLWSAVANGIDVPSASVLAWSTPIAASIGAVGITAIVALAASRTTRVTPSGQLRVE